MMPETSPDLVTSDQLSYTHEFEAADLDAISKCLEDYGFAVVKEMIDSELTQELAQGVSSSCDPFKNLAVGQTRVRHAFCEFAPAVLQLLDNEPWLAIQRQLLGTQEMTVHRCAAILKNVGSVPVSWHTDWSGYHAGEPKNASAALNVGESPSGAWFYLDGTRPNRAGLSIIPGSHRMDWEGPEGFEFTDGRSSFYPKGETPGHHIKPNPPGAVALITDPGDMILFGARTYHYASAHNGDSARRSCALGMRAGRTPYNVPWGPSEGNRFLQSCIPERYKPYLEHYVGYTPWTRK